MAAMRVSSNPEAVPDECCAGQKQQAQHDVAKIPIVQRVIKFCAKPAADEGSGKSNEREVDHLALDQAAGCLKAQRREQYAGVEALKDAAPLVLAPAPDACPQDRQRTGETGKAAKDATGKADRGIRDFAADRKGHRLAEVERGRKHQQ